MKEEQQVVQEGQNWRNARQRITDLFTGSVAEEAVLLEPLFSHSASKPPGEKTTSPERM